MWGAGGEKRSNGGYGQVKSRMGLVKSDLQRARHQIKRLAQGAYAARLLRKADENGKAERKRAQRFYTLQLFASSGPTLLRPNGHWRLA